MAVTTTNTNKPINPRGDDKSPLAFNRAKIYSGKALDFDGVNDSIDVAPTIGIENTSFSIITNVLVDSASGSFRIFQNRGTGSAGNVAGIQLSGIPQAGKYNWSNTYVDDGAGNFLNLEGNLTEFDLDKWYNLSLTWDTLTGTMKFYLNGVLVDTKVNTDLIGADLDGPENWIVAGASSTQFLNGQVSNLKAFSTALTAAQVSDLYNNPEKIVPTGVDNTALKLWLPMMEGAGTYCINGADPLGDDEYNGAGSFDSATGWTLNTGFSIGSGSLSCNGTQTANTSAYYNISSVASSLVMVQFTLSNVTAGQVQLAFFGASGTTTKWYTANGTYTEYVEVQAGHNGNTGFIANADFVGDIDDLTLKVVNTGAISGATWTHGIGAPVAQTAVIDWNKETTGAGTTMILPQGLTSGRDITGVNLFENVRKQYALNLDGQSWAEIHDNESLDFGTGSFTLEAWVKAAYINTGSSYNVILNLGDVTGTSATIVSSSTSIHFFYGGEISHPTTNDGSWVHIVGTYDGTNVTLYINGVQVNQAARTAIDTTNDLVKTIGRDTTTTRNYKDQIAQPRIYNRALTADEVEQNYNAGKNTYS